MGGNREGPVSVTLSNPLRLRLRGAAPHGLWPMQHRHRPTEALAHNCDESWAAGGEDSEGLGRELHCAVCQEVAPGCCPEGGTRSGARAAQARVLA